MHASRTTSSAAFRQSLALAFVWLALLPLPVLGQDTADCKDPVRALLPIDDTGFADWSFINPRRPYCMLRKPDGKPDSSFGCNTPPHPTGKPETVESCLAPLEITNLTADRTVVVALSIEIGPPDVRFAQALAGVLQQLRAEIDRALVTAVLDRRPEDPATSSPRAPASVPADQIYSMQAAIDARINRQPDLTEDAEAAVPSGAGPGPLLPLDKVQTITTGLAAALGDDRPCGSKRLADALREGKTKNIEDVLNACTQELWNVTKEANGSLNSSINAVVAQAKRLTDLLKHLEGDQDLKKVCKPANGKWTCTRTVTLEPGRNTQLPSMLFQELQANDSMRRTTIQVSFFGEIEKPTWDRAYLAIRNEPGESPSAVSWSFAGSILAAHQPEVDRDLTNNDPREISVVDPFDGSRRSSLAGESRTTLRGNLGDRAAVDVSFLFKSGDFGEEDQKGTARVDSYKFSVFADTGLAFSAGKTRFAAPGQGIAVSETGEGVEFAWRKWSLAHLIRRESAAGKADDPNRDASVTLLQGKGILFGQQRTFFRGMNLILLYGKEEKTDATSGVFAHTYSTAGVDATFSKPSGPLNNCTETTCEVSSALSGNLALFQSRSEDRSGLSRDAEGKAMLFTGLWTTFQGPRAKREPRSTVRLQLGYGTGDDPATAGTNEGYLGETARFAPDLLFLSQLSGAIDVGDGSGLAPGLANKEFASLSWTYHKWSLLGLIANNFLRIAEKPTAQSTTVRWNHYRFVEQAVGGNKAGDELDLVFECQLPKGVDSTLSLGYFLPGDALEGSFDDDPFIVRFSLQVKIGS